MSFFKADKAQGASSFELLEAGEYEVVISDTKVGKTKKEAPKITVTFTVRADVNQPNPKRKTFEDLTFEGAIFKVHQLTAACGFADGKEWTSIEELAKDLKYKAIRIKIAIEPNTYNGVTTDRNNIKVFMPATQPYTEGAAGVAADPFNLPGLPPIEGDLPPYAEAPADNDAPPAADETNEPPAGIKPPWEQ